MISIDTNVLLRYLLGDELRQYKLAYETITNHQPALITDVVLVEAIWTLSGKRYGLDKAGISNLIRALITDQLFVFENLQVVWSALRDYEEAKVIRGKSLDFSDALIARKSAYTANTKGAVFKTFYSFDKATEQLPLATLLT